MNETITTVAREFSFDSAHHLPHYQGPCRRPHGHTYRLRVTYRGPIHILDGSSTEAMVLDFTDLDFLVKNEVVNKLDHYDLNELNTTHVGDLALPFPDVPTAEAIANWIFAVLDAVPSVNPDIQLHSVELWETPKSLVTVSVWQYP